MGKQTKDFYEQRGEKYALWQEDRYSNFSSLFDEVAWRQFSPFLPGDAHAMILDAGCGGGGWSLRMSRLGFDRIFMLDLAEACVRGARAALARHGLSARGRQITADIEQCCLRSESFDFILCERDPLEYCWEKQDQAFSELARVLRPGGTIAMSLGSLFFRLRALLAAGRHEEFLRLRDTGVLDSEEGTLRPACVERIEELFRRHQIQKLKIAGRLTVADLVTDDAWKAIYEQPHLKDAILQCEMLFQRNEGLADASSHIFAAGRKQGTQHDQGTGPRQPQT